MNILHENLFRLRQFFSRNQVISPPCEMKFLTRDFKTKLYDNMHGRNAIWYCMKAFSLVSKDEYYIGALNLNGHISDAVFTLYGRNSDVILNQLYIYDSISFMRVLLSNVFLYIIYTLY